VREIDAGLVTDAVAGLIGRACFELGDDVVKAIESAFETETSSTGKSILSQILENARIARDERVPLCQDTGFAVIFAELGQDVAVTGGDVNDAINEGVRRGYETNYLRKSIVVDPFRRENTGDNTPAVIHMSIVPGDQIRLTFMAKGGGSENMSLVRVLTPGEGMDGVRDFVVDQVSNRGANACPPLILGIGVGGTMEKAAILSKKALLRSVGEPNADPVIADLEQSIVDACNATGVGPMGLGGKVTVLAAHVLTYPCHIASLPVALNIECHSHRHRSCEL
jgi:fumarate hydratase subunit alpha